MSVRFRAVVAKPPQHIGSNLFRFAVFLVLLKGFQELRLHVLAFIAHRKVLRLVMATAPHFTSHYPPTENPMQDKVILLVEDNLDDIQLTKRALQENNISNQLVVVHDGFQAMKYLLSAANGHDSAAVLPTVILLDLKLPKMDGHEVLRQIRADERLKCLPVVILTSSKEEQDVFKSYHLGANSYIRKPVDFEQFTDAVRNLGLYWLLLNEPPPRVVCNE